MPPPGSHSDKSARAVFHEWPFGTRGSYVTELTFDDPGEWRLRISVEEGGTTREAALTVAVTEESVVRDVGQMAAFSASKTWESSGGDLATITSHYVPDPELYRISIAEALITGKPSVIVFASPAFCTTPTCGPQVETVSELRQRYAEQANFIHVEVYDNPHEIQGDLRAARLSPSTR
jgi:hypothetical protein